MVGIGVGIGVASGLARAGLGAGSVTSSFAASDSAFVFSQGWNNIGIFVDDRNGNHAQTEGAEWNVDVFGSSISFPMKLSNDAKAYVDGAESTLTATGAWAIYTVSLGSAGWHRFRVLVGPGAYTSIMDWTATGVSVTGPAPAIRKPAASTGVDISGTIYLPNNAGVQLDGVTFTTDFAIGKVARSLYTNQGGRFRFTVVPDGSGLPISISQRIYPYGSNSQWVVTVDGVPGTVTDTPTASVASYPWQTLVTGISASGNHEIGIWMVGRAASPGNHFEFCLNNATIGSQPAACKRFAINGDSISTGQYGVLPYQGWPYKLGLLKDSPTGRAYGNWAVQGRVVTDMTNAEMDEMGAFANVSGDAIILGFGVNDQNVVSAATFQSNYISKLNYLLTKTSKKIYIRHYTECLNGSSSQATNAVTNRAAFVTAYGNIRTGCNTPSQVVEIPTTGILVPATDLSDGIHPNDSGDTKIAANDAIYVV